jgi:hypothetical protein
MMKAVPKKTKADLQSLLPKRLGGGQGDVPLPGGSPGEMGQSHAAIPSLISDTDEKSGSDGQNRTLNTQFRATMNQFKPPDNPDPDKGPRFVLIWRMYPNANNDVIKNSSNCGCGCSCLG